VILEKSMLSSETQLDSNRNKCWKSSLFFDSWFCWSLHYFLEN